MADAEMTAGNEDVANSYLSRANAANGAIQAFSEEVDATLQGIGKIDKTLEESLRSDLALYRSTGRVVDQETLQYLKKIRADVENNNTEIGKLESDLLKKYSKTYDAREQAFILSEMKIVEAMSAEGRTIDEVNQKLSNLEWFHEMDNQIEDTYTNITSTVSGSTFNQIRMWEGVKEAIKKNTDYTADQIADKTKKVDTIIADLKNKLPNYADEITKITGSAYEKQILGIKESKDKNLQNLEELKKDELASLDDQLQKELSKEGLTEEEKTKIQYLYDEMKSCGGELYGLEHMEVFEEVLS